MATTTQNYGQCKSTTTTSSCTATFSLQGMFAQVQVTPQAKKG